MNSLDNPLKELLTTKFRESKADKHPHWITPMILQSDNTLGLVFYIKQNQQTSGVIEYRSVETSKPLSQVLKDVNFIEFPQIEVYKEKDAPRQIARNTDASISIVPLRKRQKQNDKGRQVPTLGLVQYDSDSQAPKSKSNSGSRNALSAIYNYSDGSSESETSEIDAE
jgi:hypothetical protein